jgi:hypothetical protein
MNEKIGFQFVLIQAIALILMFFGLLAFIGSLFMWGEGFILPIKMGLDYSYAIPDILINAPISIIAAIGLWNKRNIGFIFANIIAGIYVYVSTNILVRVLQSGTPYIFSLLFPPIISIGLMGLILIIIWKNRKSFV